MTTRFCTSCQATKPEAGGLTKRTNTGRRWVCQGCAEHKTASIYRNQSGKTCDVAKLMNELYRRAA